ncbi:uncharacterized protein EKO05_0010658 [Ascochyta rabiei]|uniref:uncharacterized protein n=1 Tax=Didymella rabiei TaxID=5454 RepID=UPI0021FE2506|nr:uncharacterized protein EKO05_0010658 [Ascochyta rabiei]UPX20427.1 hypothetical protein EKO05_0010658 [Ascochyta rabiei]
MHAFVPRSQPGMSITRIDRCMCKSCTYIPYRLETTPYNTSERGVCWYRPRTQRKRCQSHHVRRYIAAGVRRRRELTSPLPRRSPSRLLDPHDGFRALIVDTGCFTLARRRPWDRRVCIWLWDFQSRRLSLSAPALLQTLED